MYAIKDCDIELHGANRRAALQKQHLLMALDKLMAARDRIRVLEREVSTLRQQLDDLGVAVAAREM